MKPVRQTVRPTGGEIGRESGRRLPKVVRSGRFVLAASLVGVAVVAAGCGSPAKVEVSAPSGTSSDGLTNGITVTGTGQVKGTPDTLTVNIGVTTKRPTVDAAVTDNAATTTAVTAALTSKGIDAKDIQTANYSVQPSFIFTNNKQVPDGYSVNNTVTVKLHDIKQAGATIDAATAAGGNDASVQGVSFSLEDNKALLNQARDQAFADAKAKAEQLGQLSGRGLGDAQAISETVNPQLQQFRTVGAAVSDQASTPISPGQLSTDVTITVRFSLG
jgi:uncharacterized protein YggE